MSKFYSGKKQSPSQQYDQTIDSYAQTRAGGASFQDTINDRMQDSIQSSGDNWDKLMTSTQSPYKKTVSFEDQRDSYGQPINNQRTQNADPYA